MSSQEGISLSFLLSEREAVRLDQEAFERSYDIVCERIRRSQEEETRQMPLAQWSGSRAVVGSLEMAINASRRTVEELDHLIQQVQDGTIRNTDAVPHLSVVKGDHEP